MAKEAAKLQSKHADRLMRKHTFEYVGAEKLTAEKPSSFFFFFLMQNS